MFQNFTTIVDIIDAMGYFKKGAIEHFFRSEDEAHALPSRRKDADKFFDIEVEMDSKLRLYCVRVTNEVVILLNGGVKDGYPNHCVKIYSELKRSEAKRKKLEYLTLNRPQNFQNDHYIICWPLEIVYDSKEKFCGFIMPLAFNGSEKLYEVCTIELHKKLSSGWRKFERTTSSGFQNRLKICTLIAGAIHSLHYLKKYTIVDLKPQNILLNLEGKISIIDVDSANGHVVRISSASLVSLSLFA
jgi:hypothetical protein